MIALIASIFALGIGPLIYQTLGPMRRTDRIVSGFVIIVITATLVFEVLPETYQAIGFISIALALLGFAGPTLIETLFTKSANKTHLLTIILGIFGLILHSSLDGAALYSSDSAGQHENLSLAIILHRLPVGLTIWWLLKPLIGERFALFTIILMALSTVGGYGLSMQLNAYIESVTFIALQSFISGSLLHVVLHKPHDDGCMHTSQTHELKHSHHHPESSSSYKQKVIGLIPNQWEIVGMLIGIVTMVALHHTI